MAEGGSGRSRSFWGNRFGPRPWESRICKFYALGNCFYADRCRYRHLNTSQRSTQGESGGAHGDRNVGRTQSQPKAVRERELQQTSGCSGRSSESKSPLAAGSKSSDGDLDLSSLRVGAPENTSVQQTNAEPVASRTNNSNEVGNEASNCSSHDSQEGSIPYSQSQTSDMSGTTSADPNNEEQKTTKECDKKKKTVVDVSVALQKSKDKACGICFDVIMEKSEAGRKFGILPNCNHCFCLGCIRKWRRANDFDNEITRACPECRITSDFVCPSFYWVEGKEEKDKLITDYKEALSEKNCKYFLTRRGRCPFGDKCFYKHTNTLATQATGRRPFHRRRRNVDVEITVSRLIYLWDFLVQDYDSDFSFVDPEDFETGVSILSDSDDSNDGGWSLSCDSSD